MTPTQLVLGNAAQTLGLIPLAYLAYRHWTGTRCDRAYWIIAVAFSISWVADALAHYVAGPALVARLYPLAQCLLVLATILSAEEIRRFVWVFAAVGIVGLLVNALPNDDVLFRIVCFGMIAGVVWPLRSFGRLRTALLIYFGAGLAAWITYVIAPGWWTWGAYQLTRAVGILVFCRAAACVPLTLIRAREAA